MRTVHDLQQANAIAKGCGILLVILKPATSCNSSDTRGQMRPAQHGARYPVLAAPLAKALRATFHDVPADTPDHLMNNEQRKPGIVPGVQ